MRILKATGFFRLASAAMVAVLVGCEADGTHVSVTAAEALEGGGPCALDIENYAGDVSVWVDSKLSTPTVRCYKLVPGQVADVIVTAQPPAWVAAEASDAGGRHVLRVLSKREEETDAEAVVLEIRTPTCEGIRVRNTGGRVELHGVAGAIEVENTRSVKGLTPDVAIYTDRALTAPITLSSQGGNVELAMGTNSAGRLDMDAAGGRLVVETIGGRVEGVRTDGRTWTGVINRGEHEMKLRTAGGKITVKLVTEGLDMRTPSAPGK